MQCTLYIPHLLPPRDHGAALWPTVRAPHLKSLLARARYHYDTQHDATATLCERFGIAPQQDYPLAPLLARRLGLDTRHGYWLCATPVHLETQRTALVVTDPAALQVSTAEAAALAATLTPHLAQEPVALHLPQPDAWFVCCDAAPAMTTHPLEAAIGHDMRDFLPQGADSRRWHRILTEIQMLLHDHPVNAAREARGELPLNSVWLWAGGTHPAPGAMTYSKTWSDDPVVCALAQHTGGADTTLPPPARIVPATLEEGSHFFSTDLLVAPLRDGNPNNLQTWSAAVTALDGAWFQPLLEALRTRRLSRLTVLTHDATGAHTFVLTPWDLMKFWHKNKYLQ